MIDIVEASRLAYTCSREGTFNDLACTEIPNEEERPASQARNGHVDQGLEIS